MPPPAGRQGFGAGGTSGVRVEEAEGRGIDALPPRWASSLAVQESSESSTSPLMLTSGAAIVKPRLAPPVVFRCRSRRWGARCSHR